MLEKDCIGNEQAAQLAQWICSTKILSLLSLMPNGCSVSKRALTFLSPIHLISLQKVFQLPIRNYSKRNLASLMIHTTCSFFKGFSLLCDGGCITYITPKTFWTTQTKRNLRDLLLANTLNYVFDTANPFEAVMVDTCITSAS